MSTVSERVRAGRFVSFELWPPRTPEASAALDEALEGLRALRPAFVAVTYGAGGPTGERPHELGGGLAASNLLPLPHLPCAAHGRPELVELLRRYWGAG